MQSELEDVLNCKQIRFWSTCADHAGLLHSYIHGNVVCCLHPPVTCIWHFSPRYPSPTSPSPHCPSPALPNKLKCVMLPSPFPYVLIIQHPPMSENMWCLLFCACVGLLRMMVSRFTHIPTKDTNSLFFMAV
ncbi:uncharacterized protein LOC144578386 [Callithrix jacchus]